MAGGAALAAVERIGVTVPRLSIRDAAHLTAHDFSPAFFVIGLTTLISLFFFFRLDPQHGEDMRH